MTKLSATMTLPAGGKKHWTRIMQADEVPPAHKDARAGDPLVLSHAVFADGTLVIGGVCKGNEPEFNPSFMWVFDRSGVRYPGWPIDLSDHEDFHTSGTEFAVDPSADEPAYELLIVEAGDAVTPAPAPTAPASKTKKTPKPRKKPAAKSARARSKAH